MGLRRVKGKGKALKPLQIVRIKAVPKATRRKRAKQYGPSRSTWEKARLLPKGYKAGAPISAAVAKKIIRAEKANNGFLMFNDDTGEVEIKVKSKRGRPRTKQYGPTRATLQKYRPKKGRGRPKGSKNKAIPVVKVTKKGRRVSIRKSGTSCILTAQDLKNLKRLK